MNGKRVIMASPGYTTPFGPQMDPLDPLIPLSDDLLNPRPITHLLYMSGCRVRIGAVHYG